MFELGFRLKDFSRSLNIFHYDLELEKTSLRRITISCPIRGTQVYTVDDTIPRNIAKLNLARFFSRCIFTMFTLKGILSFMDILNVFGQTSLAGK